MLLLHPKNKRKLFITIVYSRQLKTKVKDILYKEYSIINIINMYIFLLIFNIYIYIYKDLEFISS